MHGLVLGRQSVKWFWSQVFIGHSWAEIVIVIIGTYHCNCNCTEQMSIHWLCGVSCVHRLYKQGPTRDAKSATLINASIWASILNSIRPLRASPVQLCLLLTYFLAYRLTTVNFFLFLDYRPLHFQRLYSPYFLDRTDRSVYGVKKLIRNHHRLIYRSQPMLSYSQYARTVWWKSQWTPTRASSQRTSNLLPPHHQNQESVQSTTLTTRLYPLTRKYHPTVQVKITRRMTISLLPTLLFQHQPLQQRYYRKTPVTQWNPNPI